MKMTSSHESLPREMRALVQKSFGGPRDMTMVIDQPRPEPAADEYLVKVIVAGLNFADTMRSRGTYGNGPQAPYVAGFEAVGEIVAIGERVADPYPVGTHVIGVGPGGFAQFIVMPAAAVLPVPDGWTDAQSLGLVLNWVTAVAALRPLGEVGIGDVVLVHAAAGGVGQAAVRAARFYGARVVAAASPSKHGKVASLGADVVLNSASPRLAQDILDAVGQVDIVLESVGKATFDTSLTVAKPYSGRVVVFGAASGDASVSTDDLVFTHRAQIRGLHIGALAESEPEIYSAVLDDIGELIAKGVYPPGTPEVHPLAEGASALEALELGRTTGKHALDPWA